MNDDGTRPEPSPDQVALGNELVRLSNAKAWGFITLAFAADHPHFSLTPELEDMLQMGITAGQVGTVEAIKELGLA